MSIDQAAYTVGKILHRGQTRWDGSDYFENHCVPIGQSFPAGSLDRAVGYLHDTQEDCGVSEAQLTEMLVNAGSSVDAAQIVSSAVAALTHNPGESYAQSIARVTTNEIAIRVKQADLLNNLQGLTDKKHRQRRDKYLLALAILRFVGHREGDFARMVANDSDIKRFSSTTDSQDSASG